MWIEMRPQYNGDNTVQILYQNWMGKLVDLVYIPMDFFVQNDDLKVLTTRGREGFLLSVFCFLWQTSMHNDPKYMYMVVKQWRRRTPCSPCIWHCDEEEKWTRAIPAHQQCTNKLHITNKTTKAWNISWEFLPWAYYICIMCSWYEILRKVRPCKV